MAGPRFRRSPLPLALALVLAMLFASFDVYLAANHLLHPIPDDIRRGLLLAVTWRWLAMAAAVSVPLCLFAPAARQGASQAWSPAMALLAAAFTARTLAGGEASPPPSTWAVVGTVSACLVVGWLLGLALAWLDARRGLVMVVVLALVGLLWTGLVGRGAAPPVQWSPPRWQAPADSPDLVLLTIDTWRADARSGSQAPIAARTTPQLDAWFAEGRVYTTAVATAPLTGPSHAALMSGEPPWDSGVTSNGVPLSPATPWLPSFLSAGGYQTAGFVSSAMLDGELGFVRGFDVYDDDLDGRAAWRRTTWARLARPQRERQVRRQRFERSGADTLARAEAWLARAEPGRPVFLWVHVYEPHGPYEPPAEVMARMGDVRAELAPVEAYVDHPARTARPVDTAEMVMGLLGVPRRDDRGRPIEPSLFEPQTRARDLDDGQRRQVRDAVHRYLGEVRTVDGLASALRDSFPTYRSGHVVWVVTADHGESLTEHNELLAHKDHVYEANVRIPLAVLGLDRGEEGRPVSSAGVAGTLARAAGGPAEPFPCLPGEGCEGESVPPYSVVRGTDHAGRHGRVFKAGVRSGAIKLVTSWDGGAPAWEEWYDLEADCDEITPLPGGTIPADVAEQLRSEARWLLEPLLDPDSASTTEVPEAVQEALRALGYVD